MGDSALALLHYGITDVPGRGQDEVQVCTVSLCVSNATPFPSSSERVPEASESKSQLEG